MSERERLIELMTKAENDELSLLGFEKKILADYLLKNGVIVPPVKVGQKVYYLSENEIYTAEVIKIELNIFTNPQMWLTVEYHSAITGTHEYKSRIDLMLGKTVFLSKEEAEQALKGGV